MNRALFPSLSKKGSKPLPIGDRIFGSRGFSQNKGSLNTRGPRSIVIQKQQLICLNVFGHNKIRSTSCSCVSGIRRRVRCGSNGSRRSSETTLPDKKRKHSGRLRWPAAPILPVSTRSRSFVSAHQRCALRLLRSSFARMRHAFFDSMSVTMPPYNSAVRPILMGAEKWPGFGLKMLEIPDDPCRG